MKNNNEIQQAVNTALSSLHVSERDAGMLLAQAKGGKKVKKKLSMAMILTIVTILITATAVAATLIWDKYVIDLKKREQSQGEYAQWEIQSKQDLIKSLIEMGYIQESDETRKLLDDTTNKDEQEKIADKLMMLLTNQTDIKEINADIITYSIFGPESTWTSEQRVWWQQVTNMFRNTESDIDSFVLPDKGDLPESQAIAIAKAAILKAYELPADALDKARPVANMYVTKERPDYRRWDIQFQIYKEGTSDYLERVYTAVVDMSGNVIEDPDLNVPNLESMAENYKKELLRKEQLDQSPIIQIYQKYVKESGMTAIREWTIETKAAYSKEIRHLVVSAIKDGSFKAYYDKETGPTERTIIASTFFEYGLPDKQSVQIKEALDLAKKTVKDMLGFTDKGITDNLVIYPYFDITDANKPLWRFVFYPSPLGQGVSEKIVRIEIDACSSEVVSAESFERKPLLEDLEYDTKIY